LRLLENGDISQEDFDKANKILNANNDMELVKAKDEYEMLVDGVLTMSKDAARKVKTEYIDALKKQFKAGSISAKEYADGINKINESLFKIENQKSGGRAYLEGGLMGYYDHYAEIGSSKIREGAKADNDALVQMGQSMVDFANKAKQTAGQVMSIVSMVDGCIQGLVDMYNQLDEMYKALGAGEDDAWTDIGAFMSSLSAVSGGIKKIADSVMNGDVGGAASGLMGMITGPITAFAKAHDKKLQREIENAERQINALDANTQALKMFGERTLGYNTGASGLRNYYRTLYGGVSDADYAMQNYYFDEGRSGYAQELRNLEDERLLYMKMYNAEADKKNESQDALLEYKQKIAELDDQIRFFTEDMAKELWGIDFEGWADQFTDALASAFENGEDMFEAFNDTAKSIMQSVVNEMMKVGIIEPMIDKLRQQLFGYTDSSGVYHSGVVNTDELLENPSSASKKVLTKISDWFKPGGAGNSMVVAAKEYMTGIDSLLQQLGFENGVKNNESSNTLSASVQGTSEETSNLLAGYVNALLQDVAENRLLLTQFVAQFWPEYEEAFMAQVGAVNRIDNNVQAMMEMMRYGSGALYDEIRSLRARIDNVVDGAESFAMR